MGFMMGIVSTGTVILQSAINGLGYLTIAGHTAARKLNSFCTMPTVQLQVLLQHFVSQNKGADQGERIRKAVYYSNIISNCWAGIIIVILFFTAPIMVKILSGSSEAIVINNGASYFKSKCTFLWSFRNTA